MTHTPGPWRIGKRFPGRVIRGDRVVALCTPNGCDDSPNAEEAANARLIAAAPTLYAIAKLFLERLQYSDPYLDSPKVHAALAQIQALDNPSAS